MAKVVKAKLPRLVLTRKEAFYLRRVLREESERQDNYLETQRRNEKRNHDSNPDLAESARICIGIVENYDQPVLTGIRSAVQDLVNLMAI